MTVGILNGPRAAFAFLTVLPVTPPHDALETAARWMPFFPLVGLFVGATGGLSMLLLALVLPPTVAGILALGVILALTGLHHTDGLLDFGDGLMRRGSKEEKIAAMRDVATGAGGLGLGVIVLLTTAFAIASLQGVQTVFVLASAETTAKTSMVYAASIGRSASPGMNTLFIEAMHGKRAYLRSLLPGIFATLFAMLTLGLQGFLSVVAALLVTVVVNGVANSHFGGLTGDVLGAINEIARAVSILVLIAA